MIVVKNQPTMINCNWGINKDIYIYTYIYIIRESTKYVITNLVIIQLEKIST